MFVITVSEKNGPSQTLQFDQNEVAIGRVQSNDIVLPKSNISKQHARIVRNGSHFALIDVKSTNGTFVNGKRIEGPYDLNDGDRIFVGDFTLEVQDDPAPASAANDLPQADAALLDSDWNTAAPAGGAFDDDWGRDDGDESGAAAGPANDPSLDLGMTAQGPGLRRSPASPSQAESAAPAHGEMLPGLELVNHWMHDDAVRQVFVNGPSQIYVEKNGKWAKTAQAFASKQDLLRVVMRMMDSLEGRVDKSSPVAAGRLKDGSRMSVVLPPWSVDGPCFTLRKPASEALQIDDLVATETLSAAMAIFLETCVAARRNIIVAGGADTGKTTTLNVLSGFVAALERIATVEHFSEIKLEHKNVIHLQARPYDGQRKEEISIRELLRAALQLGPDRVIVGECRGAEALDLLRAIAAGHDGALTSLQAQDARDALTRMETMARAGASEAELPAHSVRELIARSIDVVVYQRRFPDGSRRVTEIAEVTGLTGETIAVQDLFLFDYKGMDAHGKLVGQFHATGAVPNFYDDLRALGFELDATIFEGR